MRGGGFTIIKHNSINHTPIKTKNFSSFEYNDSVITSSHSTLKLFIIYRPPSSSICKFFIKFEYLLECHISSSIDFLFLGNFNIKIDNINDYNTQNFKKLLQNFSLSQHVFFPTHDSGHILDLIITNVSSKFNIRPSCIDTCISDHKTVCINLNLAKPHVKKKTFSYRPIKDINFIQFNQDSVSFSNFEHLHLHLLVNYLNSTLPSIFDKYAPLKTVNVKPHTSNPWFTSNLLNEGCKRRHHPGIQCHFYADDTQIYLSFSPELVSSAFLTIESCIRDIFSWMISNKLSVNPNKTEYLLLNPNNLNLPVNIINLGFNTISPSDSPKNLGVIFKTDMSMNKHISSIIKFCFLQLCDFRCICPFISKTAAITLANAFVYSCLDFCNSLFYGLPKYSIHHLQKVQNTVAQIITNSPHFSHITPILKSLHWLPIFYCNNFKICCITHCALFLGEPFYLSTLLTHRSNTHSLRTTSFSSLLLTYFNKKSNGFRTFSYAAPFLWNHLPDTVRSTFIYMSFRRNLKTYLFNQTFPT